jgi:hypothetical protein
MELPARSTGRLAFTDPAALQGRVLVAPLQAGELLQVGDLAPTSGARSLRPVTVEVASTDVTDLSIGTEVDVLVTDGSDPSSPTAVVVTGARVLGIGGPSSDVETGSTGPQITLGVSTLVQVTAIVHAAQTGTLAVVIGAPGDQVTAGAGAASSPPSS